MVQIILTIKKYLQITLGGNMKKKNFLKLFTAFLVISILALFLNGCIIIIDSPIVEIKIANDNFTYKIYVDGHYEGTTDQYGELTLQNISEGYHHFEAEATSFPKYYGHKWQTIKSGYNKVNIYTY